MANNIKISTTFKWATAFHNAAARLEKYFVIAAFGVTAVKVASAIIVDASKKSIKR